MDKLQIALDELASCCKTHTASATSTADRAQKMDDIINRSGFSRQTLINAWEKRTCAHETDRQHKDDQSPSCTCASGSNAINTP